MIYVALSGGADSTALLFILKELGYRLNALHCNFHLRGEESNRDQAFVEQLCREQDVPLFVRHFETEAYAKQHHISIEMAARELRYGWFKERLTLAPTPGSPLTPPCRGRNQSPELSTPLQRMGKVLVAVAHHRDDQAETLLLNLLRGAGLRGMAGMQPNHDGIIRPLLCLSREEILQYLESRGQTYVTDSTNAERIALRNRIRLDAVPLLQSINPSAVEHLSLACDNARQSLNYYIKGIQATFDEQGITADTFPLTALHSLPPNSLLHEWLLGKGFNRAQETEMLTACERPVGKQWTSVSHSVVRDRNALVLASAQTSSSGCLPFALSQEIVSCIGETGSHIAYFDADLLTAPIEVRPVRPGDAFVPFGMTGRKLVSDYLTDRKVNRLQKLETYVATCAGHIIWLIGHRSDNRYRVTESTTRILRLTAAKP